MASRSTSSYRARAVWLTCAKSSVQNAPRRNRSPNGLPSRWRRAIHTTWRMLTCSTLSLTRHRSTWTADICPRRRASSYMMTGKQSVISTSSLSYQRPIWVRRSTCARGDIQFLSKFLSESTAASIRLRTQVTCIEALCITVVSKSEELSVVRKRAGSLEKQLCDLYFTKLDWQYSNAIMNILIEKFNVQWFNNA